MLMIVIEWYKYKSDDYRGKIVGYSTERLS